MRIFALVFIINRIYKQEMIKITPQKYLQGFFAAVALLALVRCIFPEIAKDRLGTISAEENTISDTLSIKQPQSNIGMNVFSEERRSTRFFKPDGTPIRNRIYSVSSFKGTFPDSNNVQLIAAEKYGVSPVTNRKEAEDRMKELVYIGSNPYYHVDKLSSSIPYLVPRAAILLQDIGRAYYDSLQIKGIPLHKIIVTSVLRTRDDIKRLRTRNGNATENSCHLYGTTFDICYNRYKTVEDPAGPPRRSVRNDTLKWVLSEVLRDFREQKRCYIKYEVKQGCFHLTVN